MAFVSGTATDEANTGDKRGAKPALRIPMYLVRIRQQ